MTATIADTWEALVTVGLLGTDRRDPPELPAGPLGDVVADALRPTPQGRLLAAVAATVVARRCGARPLPPCATLMPPDDDERPLLPVAAVEGWRRIAADWPVLESEWLALATNGRWRPPPDLLVALLRRHRRSPVIAHAVVAWGGALAAWLVDHVPDLAPVDGRPPSSSTRVKPLPVPAELEPLLAAPAEELAHALVAGLAEGRYRFAHRAVLLNAVARMDPGSLPTVRASLERGRDLLTNGGDAAPLSLWEALIELAAVRQAMLTDLEVAP